MSKNGSIILNTRLALEKKMCILLVCMLHKLWTMRLGLFYIYREIQANDKIFLGRDLNEIYKKIKKNVYKRTNSKIANAKFNMISYTIFPTTHLWGVVGTRNKKAFGNI